MYNAIIDVLVIGSPLIVVAAYTFWPRKKRGATPATTATIIKHQKIRRIENANFPR